MGAIRGVPVHHSRCQQIRVVLINLFWYLVELAEKNGMRPLLISYIDCISVNAGVCSVCVSY